MSYNLRSLSFAYSYPRTRQVLRRSYQKSSKDYQRLIQALRTCRNKDLSNLSVFSSQNIDYELLLRLNVERNIGQLVSQYGYSEEDIGVLLSLIIGALILTASTVMLPTAIDPRTRNKFLFLVMNFPRIADKWSAIADWLADAFRWSFPMVSYAAEYFAYHVLPAAGKRYVSREDVNTWIIFFSVLMMAAMMTTRIWTRGIERVIDKVLTRFSTSFRFVTPIATRFPRLYEAIRAVSFQWFAFAATVTSIAVVFLAVYGFSFDKFVFFMRQIGIPLLINFAIFWAFEIGSELLIVNAYKYIGRFFGYIRGRIGETIAELPRKMTMRLALRSMMHRPEELLDILREVATVIIRSIVYFARTVRSAFVTVKNTLARRLMLHKVFNGVRSFFRIMSEVMYYWFYVKISIPMQTMFNIRVPGIWDLLFVGGWIRVPIYPVFYLVPRIPFSVLAIPFIKSERFVGEAIVATNERDIATAVYEVLSRHPEILRSLIGRCARVVSRNVIVTPIDVIGDKALLFRIQATVSTASRVDDRLIESILHEFLVIGQITDREFELLKHLTGIIGRLNIEGYVAVVVHGLNEIPFIRTTMGRILEPATEIFDALDSVALSEHINRFISRYIEKGIFGGFDVAYVTIKNYHEVIKNFPEFSRILRSMFLTSKYKTFAVTPIYYWIATKAPQNPQVADVALRFANEALDLMLSPRINTYVEVTTGVAKYLSKLFGTKIYKLFKPVARIIRKATSRLSAYSVYSYYRRVFEHIAEATLLEGRPIVYLHITRSGIYRINTAIKRELDYVTYINVMPGVNAILLNNSSGGIERGVVINISGTSLNPSRLIVFDIPPPEYYTAIMRAIRARDLIFLKEIEKIGIPIYYVIPSSVDARIDFRFLRPSVVYLFPPGGAGPRSARALLYVPVFWKGNIAFNPFGAELGRLYGIIREISEVTGLPANRLYQNLLWYLKRRDISIGYWIYDITFTRLELIPYTGTYVDVFKDEISTLSLDKRLFGITIVPYESLVDYLELIERIQKPVADEVKKTTMFINAPDFKITVDKISEILRKKIILPSVSYIFVINKKILPIIEDPTMLRIAHELFGRPLPSGGLPVMTVAVNFAREYSNVVPMRLRESIRRYIYDRMRELSLFRDLAIASWLETMPSIEQLAEHFIALLGTPYRYVNMFTNLPKPEERRWIWEMRTYPAWVPGTPYAIGYSEGYSYIVHPIHILIDSYNYTKIMQREWIHRYASPSVAEDSTLRYVRTPRPLQELIHVKHMEWNYTYTPETAITPRFVPATVLRTLVSAYTEPLIDREVPFTIPLPNRGVSLEAAIQNYTTLYDQYSDERDSKAHAVYAASLTPRVMYAYAAMAAQFAYTAPAYTGASAWVPVVPAIVTGVTTVIGSREVNVPVDKTETVATSASSQPPPSPPNLFKFFAGAARRLLKQYIFGVGKRFDDRLGKLLEILCFLITGRFTYSSLELGRESICDALVEHLRRRIRLPMLFWDGTWMLVHYATDWVTLPYLWNVVVEHWSRWLGGRKVTENVIELITPRLGVKVSMSRDDLKELLDSLVEAGIMEKKVEEGTEYYRYRMKRG